MRFFIFYIAVFCCWYKGEAQIQPKRIDSVQQLKTVRITNYLLREFSVGQSIRQFDQTELVRHSPSLTQVLLYNTPIFFKENGLGMVSSPSFRGTTAAQTAVLWNGINVNSNLNGQTDFNLINTRNTDQIEVRAGGGSLVFGSGAIGGTIHLHTELPFQKQLSHALYTGYGSFHTLDNQYQFRVSDEKWSFRIAGSHNSSDNDYKLSKQKRKNQNARFRNFGINADLGYQIDSNNRLYWYNQFYASNRHFPIFYSSETPTKYEDKNQRSLLEWQSLIADFRTNLKVAFLHENYRYFPDAEGKNHSFGETQTLLTKYNIQFKPGERISWDVLLDYEYIRGKGTDIDRAHRSVFSAGLLMKHQLLTDLRYQLGIRQEITKSSGTPFLLDFGVEWEGADFYVLKLSASKNFRRPTFNDYYWTDSGNPNLKAERSLQVELGNQFTLPKTHFAITGYFNNIRDMIRWLPSSNGLFKPVNEEHIHTYGIEVGAERREQFGNHILEFNSTYAYTRSENKKSNKQLIYVPYHKLTGMITYSRKKISLDYQLLYNGSVFLRTDNNPRYKLADYWISNLGFSYATGENKNWTLGAKVRNLFNAHYENVERYEMPGINYNLYINLNF